MSDDIKKKAGAPPAVSGDVLSKVIPAPAIQPDSRSCGELIRIECAVVNL